MNRLFCHTLCQKKCYKIILFDDTRQMLIFCDIQFDFLKLTKQL